MGLGPHFHPLFCSQDSEVDESIEKHDLRGEELGFIGGARMERVNAFRIDLEEWYHSELVEGRRSSFSQAAEATTTRSRSIGSISDEGFILYCGRGSGAEP